MLFQYEQKKFDTLEEHQFLNKQGKIDLSLADIETLMLKYNIDDIVKAISKVLDKYPYPYSIYSEYELKQDYKDLINHKIDIVDKQWNSPSTLVPSAFLSYKGEFLSTPKNKSGTKLLDSIMQEKRSKVRHKRYVSQYDLWHRPDKYWIKPLFQEKSPVREENFAKALSRKGHESNYFRPTVAKDIIDFFNAKSVLDFSMGWGGRLLGFHTSNAESYVGIDPNSSIQYDYQRINQYCKSEKNTKFICSPSEEADLSNVNCDLIFSSPPYINWKYSDESTQVYNRYGDKETWLNEYLYPTLEKCWSRLDGGGRLVVLMIDPYYQGNREMVVKPMYDFMVKLGAKPEGVIGYSKSSRSKKISDKLNTCDPMFVFAKGKAPDPKYLGFQPSLFDL